MKTFFCAVLIAVVVAWLAGCSVLQTAPERLADKCYAFGGKATVAAAGDAYRVGCR